MDLDRVASAASSAGAATGFGSGRSLSSTGDTGDIEGRCGAGESGFITVFGPERACLPCSRAAYPVLLASAYFDSLQNPEITTGPKTRVDGTQLTGRRCTDQ